jgi:2-polyprenyl-3-methyl-5-hydroxy-6-metoxy-1,4-benzoquinol methylase
MKILAKNNSYILVDDIDKGYIHVEPIPSESELDKVYEEYYQNEKPNYIDNTIEDLDWWQTQYRDKFDIFDNYVFSNNKTILDIGCGSGYFLKFGQNRGWTCYGIEPSKQAANYAKNNGINVINEKFKKELFQENIFNVIHMNQVLEHIPYPEDTLNDIFALLKDDGIVSITVPNDFSPLQNLLVENLNYKQWWVSPPFHLNYFTVDSLETLLKKHNFSIILKETTFPLELFLLMDEDYISKPEIGRDIHKKRKMFDLKLSKYNNKLKRKLYQTLADLNIGRTITIYAKKKVC